VVTDGPPPIPLLDLQAEHAALRDDLDRAYARVRDSGQFVLGPEVSAFEAEAAAALGVGHAVGLSSGTDALTIALRIAGVGPGDEVITSPFSFFATSETVLLLGATPVFVDLAPDTFLIDPQAVADAITPRTKAIVPVHLYGELAPLQALRELAEQHGLVLIEDAAQAFGARYAHPCAACPTPHSCGQGLVGRGAGGLGHLAAFSFYPTKNLGALGDAGLLTTDDAEMARHARMLRNHGGEARYDHQLLGYNARLDALQAAFLRVKLPHLEGWTEARRAAADRYRDLLADVPGVTLPAATPGHVYHQFTLRIAEHRDALAAALQARGVATMVYYPHTLERYGGRSLGDLPEAHRVAAEALSLPLYPSITGEVQRRVAEAIRDALPSQRATLA